MIGSHRTRGSTLAEVLITTAVFSILSAAAFVIMHMGTGSFHAVQAKTDIQRQLRNFEGDIIQEIGRASLGSVGVYTPADDYRWAVWMQTAMNAPGGSPAALGDPTQLMMDSSGNPVLQRYVLYYVARMDPAEHQQQYGYLCASYPGGASPDGGTGPDRICPHKWIIKKELYLTNAGQPTIGLQGDPLSNLKLQTLMTDAPRTEAGVVAEERTFLPGSPVNRSRVMAQNILSFELARLATVAGQKSPVASATGNIILFDVKAFKADEAQHQVAVGSAPLVVGAAPTLDPTSGQMVVPVATTAPDSTGQTQVQIPATVQGTAGNFTVQLDARVTPRMP